MSVGTLSDDAKVNPIKHAKLFPFTHQYIFNLFIILNVTCLIKICCVTDVCKNIPQDTSQFLTTDINKYCNTEQTYTWVYIAVRFRSKAYTSSFSIQSSQ